MGDIYMLVWADVLGSPFSQGDTPSLGSSRQLFAPFRSCRKVPKGTFYGALPPRSHPRGESRLRRSSRRCMCTPPRCTLVKWVTSRQRVFILSSRLVWRTAPPPQPPPLGEVAAKRDGGRVSYTNNNHNHSIFRMIVSFAGSLTRLRRELPLGGSLEFGQSDKRGFLNEVFLTN